MSCHMRGLQKQGTMMRIYSRSMILNCSPVACSDVVRINGTCYLNWWHKNHRYCFKFANADMVCESVLGRQACFQIELLRRVNGVSLKDYQDILKGLGCLPGEDNIVVDPSVPPVVSALRNVAIALHEKL